MQPTWEDKEYGVQLYLADCMDVLPHLGKVDAVVTDPPYGIGRLAKPSSRLCEGMPEYRTGAKWDEQAANISWIIDMFLPTIIWGGNYFSLPPYRAPLVWDKNNAGRDFSDFEMAWTNLDMVARRIIYRPMNMDGGKLHPTQKPITVMLWCLGFLLNAKNIFDPFMGSGTTGVAAVQLGRKFIGVEIEPRYFKIAVDRISKAIIMKQGGPLCATHIPEQYKLPGVEL